MFTNNRCPDVPLTGDWRQDGPVLRRWLQDYFLSLEKKDALNINEARITASQGIKFPATQVASTDVNTLDDYEEGTWTPVLTFATPGNLSVTYSAQYGDVTKIGREVLASFRVATSAFTHTTASGNLQITGLPYTSSSDTNYIAQGAMVWTGITKAGYTQVSCALTAGVSLLVFAASGSGVGISNVAAADMPTGGSVVLRGTIRYRV